ncbi:uncharacterized protein L969DRAFT_86013 [Mixia osmundae IAM 14324]|uniref:Uncharacterized protein n=1 Tax=Mixia osmundae (strain CBS 9802 / IAM 14324 / JCM 22182 / KY 12970) TaxID=764103 RepID=G7E5F9_MIXOS|nr:uncharacterized protein L969DRAFT_86013 [Mixia osmundae IAM 14324]KEI40780.1 hypothetical protein L969DRAFT_86013 [Mixia osmundae IAM 14324]GAA98069.1 hypothetical protein E5Q_04751 [Mixia osmundae IAM 14324]
MSGQPGSGYTFSPTANAMPSSTRPQSSTKVPLLERRTSAAATSGGLTRRKSQYAPGSLAKPLGSVPGLPGANGDRDSMTAKSGSGTPQSSHAASFAPSSLDYSDSSTLYGAASPPPHTAVPSGTPASAQNLVALRETIQKRITTWNYLKQVYMGKVHWFDTVLLQKEDLERGAGDPALLAKRSNKFFVLGTSLATLIDTNVPADFLRALLALVNEYEAQGDDLSSGSGGNRPRMKSLLKGKGKAKIPGGGSYDDDSYLYAMNIPFELEYFQVFLALCDILVKIYERINSYITPNQNGASTGSPTSPQFTITSSGFPQPPGLNSTLVETAQKADNKLKKIVALVTKETDAVARSVIRDELFSLDPTLS